MLSPCSEEDLDVSDASVTHVYAYALIHTHVHTVDVTDTDTCNPKLVKQQDTEQQWTFMTIFEILFPITLKCKLSFKRPASWPRELARYNMGQ